MSNNIENLVTDSQGTSANNGEILKVSSFKLLKSGIFRDRHRYHHIWLCPDGSHMVALSPVCSEDEFRDEKCDCRNFYLNDVKHQISEKNELFNGWRTCLYQFWSELEASVKVFDDLMPYIYYEKKGWNSYNIWFCVTTKQPFEKITERLGEIFDSDIEFV